MKNFKFRVLEIENYKRCIKTYVVSEPDIQPYPRTVRTTIADAKYNLKMAHPGIERFFTAIQLPSRWRENEPSRTT